MRAARAADWGRSDSDARGRPFLEPAELSCEDPIQPIVKDGIRQWQIAELAVGVSPFRHREDPLRPRTAHATAEALEQLHRNRALAFPHQRKARTADIPKRAPGPKIAQALQPRRYAVHPEAAAKRLEAELHAGRHLLIG